MSLLFSLWKNCCFCKQIKNSSQFRMVFQCFRHLRLWSHRWFLSNTNCTGYKRSVPHFLSHCLRYGCATNDWAGFFFFFCISFVRQTVFLVWIKVHIEYESIQYLIHAYTHARYLSLPKQWMKTLTFGAGVYTYIVYV